MADNSSGAQLIEQPSQQIDSQLIWSPTIWAAESTNETAKVLLAVLS